MKNRISLLRIGLAAWIAFTLAEPWAWAQPQSPTPPQPAPQTTITDAAGRIHKVMPMHRITQAQRKAAAKRLKATRGSKSGQTRQNPTDPPPQQEGNR